MQPQPEKQFKQQDSRPAQTGQKIQPTPPNQKALPAGQWVRAVLGFQAPFGHDGLPTVWG